MIGINQSSARGKGKHRQLYPKMPDIEAHGIQFAFYIKNPLILSLIDHTCMMESSLLVFISELHRTMEGKAVLLSNIKLNTFENSLSLK